VLGARQVHSIHRARGALLINGADGGEHPPSAVAESSPPWWAMCRDQLGHRAWSAAVIAVRSGGLCVGLGEPQCQRTVGMEIGRKVIEHPVG